MKIKRLKKLRVNSKVFTIKWDYNEAGGHFDYRTLTLELNGKFPEDILFEVLCHELMEIVAVDMNVRLDRPDVLEDYIFVYDHRQFTTMMSMYAGLITQFLG